MTEYSSPDNIDGVATPVASENESTEKNLTIDDDILIDCGECITSSESNSESSSESSSSSTEEIESTIRDVYCEKCTNDVNNSSSNNTACVSDPNYSSLANVFQQITDQLLPALTKQLYATTESKYGHGSSSDPTYELVSSFNSLSDGLDKIRNDKIRAICFMDRLTKFHEKVGNYDKTNSSSYSSDFMSSTALSLSSDKLRGEMSNVMSQLSQ